MWMAAISSIHLFPDGRLRAAFEGSGLSRADPKGGKAQHAEGQAPDRLGTRRLRIRLRRNPIVKHGKVGLVHPNHDCATLPHCQATALSWHWIFRLAHGGCLLPSPKL